MSWKINWTDLLNIQWKAFGLSDRMHEISVEVLRKYTDTMPERCAAVIAAKGEHTKC